MNIFRSIYLKTLKHKFYRPFKPLGIKRKDNFVISVPYGIKDFFKTLPFLGGMRKLGNVILLAPERFVPYLKIFKTNIFQTVYWTNFPKVLTNEYEFLKKELRNYQCNWLIELNTNANLALPTLIDVEKRIAFYNKKNFPYYNILIKEGIETLVSFFQISVVDPVTLFKFNKLELKAIEKKMPNERPLLFFNQTEIKKEIEDIKWSGGVVIHNKDKDKDMIEKACEKLYLCDAYYGPDDEFCELARIFKKEIIIL